MSGEQHEVFSGVPAWLLVEYLVSLGGQRGDDGVVTGEGWRARLESMPRARSFGIGRVTVTIDGPQASLVMAKLREKAQRGGG